jgi:hypothetical protein
MRNFFNKYCFRKGTIKDKVEEKLYKEALKMLDRDLDIRYISK